MRPSKFLFLVCLLFLAINIASIILAHKLYRSQKKGLLLSVVVSELNLTDPCISTEARYTRHPSLSDAIVPVMDHPGALEHFPTGSFWVPPHKWFK